MLSTPYANLQRRLDVGGIVILDGGTGTELERRGVPMDTDAWCGPAAIGHLDTLEAIHREYIAAGADIVTVNTFASSRPMLAAAGFGGSFEEINRAAIQAAARARSACANDTIAIAGSLSHMLPPNGDVRMANAFGELATFLAAEGCDFILLEMMYRPDRMRAAFAAAAATGLPVWAGFSVRRGNDGSVLSYMPETDVAFAEIVELLAEFDVAAAGIMHSSPNVTGDALRILRARFRGPLFAYPDSGYFKMPNWQFDNIIPPGEFSRFARQWAADGVQILGGCCGLSPAHIAAIAPLKADAPC